MFIEHEIKLYTRFQKKKFHAKNLFTIELEGHLGTVSDYKKKKKKGVLLIFCNLSTVVKRDSFFIIIIISQ